MKNIITKTNKKQNKNWGCICGKRNPLDYYYCQWCGRVAPINVKHILPLKDLKTVQK